MKMMTHRIESFAQEMARAARDRRFKPSSQQAQRMTDAADRFNQDGGGE